MNSRNISKGERLKESKDFDNLKSDYFLIKIMNIIKRNKSLEIMKYNKKLQKRLNININNYKEYSQLYSSIEIELKPAVNKYDNIFINISVKEKEYYQIYFDNSIKELRNFLTNNEKVKVIKIIISYQVESFKELFENCRCINSIFFKKF